MAGMAVRKFPEVRTGLTRGAVHLGDGIARAASGLVSPVFADDPLALKALLDELQLEEPAGSADWFLELLQGIAAGGQLAELRVEPMLHRPWASEAIRNGRWLLWRSFAMRPWLDYGESAMDHWVWLAFAPPKRLVARAMQLGGATLDFGTSPWKLCMGYRELVRRDQRALIIPYPYVSTLPAVVSWSWLKELANG